jgi:hypothetical protein
MSAKDWVKSKIQYDGFVYIVKIHSIDKVVFKVGTTNRTVKTRMLEIAGELFGVLGHIPKIELIRERQTKDNYKIEAQILRETEKHRCNLGMLEWSGESELRKMDQQELLNIYDRAIAEDFAPTIKFEVEL